MAVFHPIPLDLPPAPLKLRRSEGQVWVFDPLRKKDLLCTPEEWVRQHWIHYLTAHRDFPKSLIVSESGIKLNGLAKRSDLIVYNTFGRQVLLAEFKQPGVKINQAVFDQIARYNSIYQIPFLLVSNGLNHHYCQIDLENSTYKFLSDLPDFKTIAG